MSRMFPLLNSSPQQVTTLKFITSLFHNHICKTHYHMTHLLTMILLVTIHLAIGLVIQSGHFPTDFLSFSSFLSSTFQHLNLFTISASFWVKSMRHCTKVFKDGVLSEGPSPLCWATNSHLEELLVSHSTAKRHL